MILNAIASTIGHAFSAQPHTEQSERKSLVQKALETASESRAYAEAYHPLDTAFWTSRDYYRYLGDIGDTPDIQAQRQQALLNMSDALDKAGELGDLPYDQTRRISGRIVDLMIVQELDPAQLTAVLAHERARSHSQRRTAPYRYEPPLDRGPPRERKDR